LSSGAFFGYFLGIYVEFAPMNLVKNDRLWWDCKGYIFPVYFPDSDSPDLSVILFLNLLGLLGA